MNPQVPGLIMVASDGPAPVCADGVCAPVPDGVEAAAPAASAPAGVPTSAD